MQYLLVTWGKSSDYSLCITCSFGKGRSINHTVTARNGLNIWKIYQNQRLQDLEDFSEEQ